MSTSDEDIAAWSRYWRTGPTASCTESGVASSGFDRFWEDVFSSVSPRAHIVDLATGNGYVASLACSFSARHSRQFVVVGVDAADIDERSVARAPGETAGATLRLQGNTRLEALPFADRQFDLAVSQFGFEYAEPSAAISELARVLKPDGAFHFIMHAREGAIFAAVFERVERLGRLMRQGGLFDTIREGAICLIQGDRDVETQIDAALRRIKTELAPLAQSPPPDDAALFYSSGLTQLWDTRARYAPEDLLASVNDAYGRVRAQLARQQNLIGAAHSPDSLDTLRSTMARHGLDTAPPAATRDEFGAQIAWSLRGRKPSG
jgi:SAM-dependent methyltransferase